MADFPGTIPSFTDLVDNQDDVLAVHQNVPNDEITALATFIGNVGSGLTQAYSVDLLAFLLGNATNISLAYVSASTIIASAGVAVITNSGVTQRVLRKNTTTTNITGANLDSGGPSLAVSTRYYVYAVGDSAANTVAFVLSTNSSAPSGYTRYLKVGTFLTDGSGNVIDGSVLSTAIADAKPAGASLQKVFTSSVAALNGTPSFPLDTSKPQVSEALIVLSKSVYAHYTTSKFRVRAILSVSSATGNGGGCAAALFCAQITATDSIAATQYHIATDATSIGTAGNIRIEVETSAIGTIAEAIFKAGIGYGGGSVWSNTEQGTALFGGQISSIEIEEIKA